MRSKVFTNSDGVPFTVLLIGADEDGPNASRTKAGRSYATVEFWDARYKRDDHSGFHPEYGQFTGGYYRRQDLHDPGRGLNLAGGVPEWSIDAATYADIVQWLDHGQ